MVTWEGVVTWVDKWNEFVAFLNNIHVNIKFTVETEQAGCSPFLDILISGNQDGSLGRNVYRKPTHTNLYLYSSSHHSLTEKVCDCYLGE